ncbi:MAG: hypothetical protein V9G15_06385 [Dermatophilaceae bacterium]
MSQDVEDVPLLVASDLPAGWVMPDPPVIASSAESVAIDAALKYDKLIYPTPGPDGELDGYNDGRDGRWFLIEHVQSYTRVLLRLQRQYLMHQEPMGEVRITGIIYLPEQAGDPVASPMLRNLPTSRIEAAINRRQFAVTGATRFEGGTLTMPSGRILQFE